MKIIQSLIFTVVMFSFTQSFAALSPVGVGLVSPVQFPPRASSVTGARLSGLWGMNHALYGLDLGLLGNITTHEFRGLAVSGLFNNTRGDTKILGLQLAGATNLNMQKTSIYGLQAALGLNYNDAESKLIGVGLAAVNLTEFTTVYGAQVGLYNKAKDVYGIQIGIINVAKNLHGIQIGLLNFHTNGLFVASPIINAGF
jgi:hypothetical protein